jgi:uncharacterized membrane protein YeaQ/YmgE (transglycosylase-associated protein family)
MREGTAYVLVLDTLLAVLSGWLVPIIFKSRRPYGVVGDILVCVVVAVALAYVEWTWILPALGFTAGWLSLAAVVGDPLGLAWICLWLMRKIRG